jgi:hypothetical protein
MPVTDLHHLCHNTKWRRKKFPLFLNSIFNLRPVSNSYHLAYPSWGKITDYQAEKYELFLRKHNIINYWVNNPTKDRYEDNRRDNNRGEI